MDPLVAIALEEYKTLNAELLQRNTIFVQVSAATIAAIATIAGFKLADKLTWLIAGVLFTAAVLAWGLTLRVITSDAEYASYRLIEIEHYIRALTGETDARFPLSYQSRFGIHGRGFFDRFREFDPNRARSSPAVPPINPRQRPPRENLKDPVK
jgi:hypothetical protein